MRSLLSNVEIYQKQLVLTRPVPVLGSHPRRGPTYTHSVAHRSCFAKASAFVMCAFVIRATEANGMKALTSCSARLLRSWYQREGKSTLVKLLCRLYDPEEGSVERQDRHPLFSVADLHFYNHGVVSKYRSRIMQLPGKYRDNIVRAPTSPGRFGGQACRCPRRNHGLPHGCDTLLGKWFCGWHRTEWGRRVAAHRVCTSVFATSPDYGIGRTTSSAWIHGPKPDWFERLHLPEDPAQPC